MHSGVAARAAAEDAAPSPSQAGDSTSRRVGGALENALAYVAIVAAIVRARVSCGGPACADVRCLVSARPCALLC